MPYAVVEEKLRSLPQAALDDVGKYLDYLLFKFGSEETENPKLINRRAGIVHDENFYMAPDFDETPECFKDYI